MKSWSIWILCSCSACLKALSLSVFSLLPIVLILRVSFQSVWTFWMLIHLFLVGWRLLSELYVPIRNAHSRAKLKLKAGNMGPYWAESSKCAVAEIAQTLSNPFQGLNTLMGKSCLYVELKFPLFDFMWDFPFFYCAPTRRVICVFSVTPFHTRKHLQKELTRKTKDKLIFKALSARIAKSCSV